MWEDPIVVDVRRVRQELSAKFDFDVAAIFDDLRNRQINAGKRLVRLEEESGSDNLTQQRTQSVAPD